MPVESAEKYAVSLIWLPPLPGFITTEAAHICSGLVRKDETASGKWRKSTCHFLCGGK